MNAALLILMLTLAQPPGTRPVEVPLTKAESQETVYRRTLAQAVKERKPMALFVAAPTVDLGPGVLVATHGEEFADRVVRGPLVLLAVPDPAAPNGMRVVAKLDPSRASAADMKAALGMRREVSAGQAVPFAPSSQSASSDQPAAATAEPADEATGPWLSSRRRQKIVRAWPKGVPFPDNLQFYDIPQVYQSRYSRVPSIPHRDIVYTRDSEEHPWRVSGGMNDIPHEEWRSVKGLSLPGKVIVWDQLEDAGAPVLVTKTRWVFPKGTEAYDVLFKRNRDGSEHIFEVRVREKTDDGWDNGTTYRPKARVENQEGREVVWRFERVGLFARGRVFKTTIDRKAEFVPTVRVVADDDFTPYKYAGAGMSCNTCHQHAGTSSGYGTARRGDDMIFSWHPFDVANGGFDRRWPIDVR